MPPDAYGSGKKRSGASFGPDGCAGVRLVLNPGQTAGLDSEEGKSLNFTCGDNAAALFVDTGEREQLLASQRSALPPAAFAETGLARR